jgi:hypothetical protein
MPHYALCPATPQLLTLKPL